MTAFSTIKLRTAAVVRCEQHIALIRRTKGGTEQYTLPGGNVEAGEELHAALRRELAEELGLELPHEPRLLAVQDQMVTRPGATPPPRKLHLVFLIDITTEVRDQLATIEHDDLDGDEGGDIVWMPLDQASAVHLYPAIGDTLEQLTAGQAVTEGVAAVLLPGLTDRNYRWT